MKLSKRQIAERNKKAKQKAHWKSYYEGQAVEKKTLKAENQKQYERFLAVLDDLNASKRIAKAIENKAELELLNFAADLFSATIKDVFENGLYSIRPDKRADRRPSEAKEIMLTGTTSFFDLTK